MDRISSLRLQGLPCTDAYLVLNKWNKDSIKHWYVVATGYHVHLFLPDLQLLQKLQLIAHVLHVYLLNDSFLRLRVVIPLGSKSM